MKSILEAFANDNIQPNAREYRRNSKYGRAAKQLSDAEEALRSALNENERKLLESFMNAQSSINYLSLTDKFLYGYRLGVLMTMEVFCMDDAYVFSGESE